MAELIGICIIILVIAGAAASRSNTEYSSGPTIVSTQMIVYPEVICPHCEKEVEVTPQTIDGYTWDLKCLDCNKIAYEHPEREERMQCIDDMLDM